MKTTLKILAVLIAMVGFSAASYAQVSATATATSTIVTPLSITKTADMNFGNVAVNDDDGTVVLSPAGGRTPSGGVSLPSTTGTVSAAAFTVSGQSGYTYGITLPSSNVTVTRQTGSETMIVNTFVSNPTVAAGGVLTGGTQTLYVGATLNVSGQQVAGTYASENFTITVIYN